MVMTAVDDRKRGGGSVVGRAFVPFDAAIKRYETNARFDGEFKVALKLRKSPIRDGGIDNQFVRK